MFNLVLAAAALAASDYRHFEPSAKDLQSLRTAAFDACLGGSGGMTSNMRECSAAESNRLDALLNLEYRNALARLPTDSARRRLRSVQRGWLKTRWNHCRKEMDEERGGTLALLIGDGCSIDEMSRRIVWLRHYR